MHVTVVPEIEMPGHCTAALTAYPELACGQPPASVETRWGIFEHVLCLGEPQTLTFIKDVVSKVADLFPGPWVHVGGDEVEPGRWRACPKCQAMAAKLGLPDEQALKAWWLGQVQRIVAEAGKRMITWDELLVDGSLPPASAVQWWRAHKRDVIQQALAANHPLIVSPYDPWYLSFPQAQEEMRRKPKWMSINDLRRVYLFEPLPSASPAPDREALILGGEAPLWTERTADEDEMSQRMWPRLLAVSERLWSSRDARDWSDFARRVNQRLPAVEAAGVHVYRPSQPPAVSE